MRELIKKMLCDRNEYIEVRLQENRSEGIVLLNGDVIENNKIQTQGVSIRSFKNGCWGFASTDMLDEVSLNNCLNEALKNTDFLVSKAKSTTTKELPTQHFASYHDFTTKKNRWNGREKIEFIKELDNLVVKRCKNLKGRNLLVKNLDMQKELFLMDKGRHYSMIPRSHILCILSSEDKEGSPIKIMEPLGSLGQMEDCFTTPEELLPKIHAAYEHLQKKKDAVYADAEAKTVVLDSNLAGILAHEAIGHTTEADLVLGGSMAGDFLGRKVASDLITLVDFANSYNDRVLPVPVYVDDEGTRCEDAVLIEEGVLKSYLHNKESALHFNHTPTGNARAYLYSDEPLIRMRNTAILPGQSTLEEMIASIDDGYYLIKPSNGQADSTSEFMFGVPVGYEIKNGKLARAIKETTISGVAFELLQTVTMVSKDMKWENFGMCGKKQLIPVGMGGPAIKCQVNMGGK